MSHITQYEVKNLSIYIYIIKFAYLFAKENQMVGQIWTKLIAMTQGASMQAMNVLF